MSQGENSFDAAHTPQKGPQHGIAHRATENEVFWPADQIPVYWYSIETDDWYA